MAVLLLFLKFLNFFNFVVFFFSSRRRHTRFKCDWSSDVCSSDLLRLLDLAAPGVGGGHTEGGEAIRRVQRRLGIARLEAAVAESCNARRRPRGAVVEGDVEGQLGDRRARCEVL